MSRSRDLALIFHGVGTPPPHVTATELPYWMQEDAFAAFVAGAGSRAIELGVTLVATIDDGNRSDRAVVAPLLLRHGMRGIFFPCAGRIGQRPYVDAADIRALAQDGFEIGSHGMDHVAWTTLDDAALNREIAGSKARLEEVLGREVHSAALPFGAYNRRVLRAVRAAGYRTVYNSDNGWAGDGAWFRRRWCYRTDVRFDLVELAAISASPRHRLVTAAKAVVKSLR